MFEKAKTVLKAARAAVQNKSNVWSVGISGGFFDQKSRKTQRAQLDAFTGDVYNFVDYRAEKISFLEGHIYYFDNKGEQQVIDEHPFYNLLQHPNQVHTKEDILYLLESHLGLTGNAYWYTPKNGLGQPGEILPLLPPYVKVVPGEGQEIITGYIYERAGKKIPFDVDEITHFRLPNPLDPYYYGMSPIAAEQAQIASLDAIEKYKRAVFDNMGSPSLFAKLNEQYIGRLNDKKKRDEFQEEFRAMYQGVKNAGGVVVHAGIEDLKNMTGEKEISYLKSEEAGRKKLSNTFKVPLALMFDQTGALGRSIIESEEYRFYRDAIMPRAKKIAGVITKDLLPLYDEGLWYEFEDETPQDKEFELKKEESRLRTWVWEPNYVREQDGLNPEPWGEKPLAPFSIAPLSTEPRGGVSNSAPATGAKAKEMAEDGTYQVVLPNKWVKYLQSKPEDGMGWHSVFWVLMKNGKDFYHITVLNCRVALFPWEVDGEDIDDMRHKKDGKWESEEPAEPQTPPMRRIPELTDELRERYWNAFTRSADKAEKTWEDDLVSVIKEHERTVLKNLKNLYGKGFTYERKGAEDFIMIGEEAAKIGFWQGSRRGVNQSIESGMSLAEAKIGVPGIISNPDMHFAEHIRLKELKIKTIPAAEYHNYIRSAIRDGVQQGKEYEEMRGVIQQAFKAYTDRVDDWKVDRIVRTEVTETVNFAQLESAKESKVVSHKVWLGEMDDVIREEHAMTHGQERPVDEAFDVAGSPAMYPGDPSLPVESICNCRCDQLFARYEEVPEV